MSVREVPLPENLLTVDAVAAAQGVTVRAVQRWIAEGLLPAVVLGSGNRVVYLVRAQDVKRFATPKRGRPES